MRHCRVIIEAELVLSPFASDDGQARPLMFGVLNFSGAWCFRAALFHRRSRRTHPFPFQDIGDETDQQRA
jgi:hypothetical protein